LTRGTREVLIGGYCDFWCTVKGCSFQEIGLNAMDTRTIELDRNDLDKSLEVLSSAQTLQLTRFEKISYRALIVSVDVAAACYIAWQLIGPLISDEYLSILAVIVLGAILVGLAALALNIPLFRRAFREKGRLKELGLSSLTKSLWKESHWSRVTNRIRGVVLITCVIVLILAFLLATLMHLKGSNVVTALDYIAPLIGAIIVGTLFAGTRYLQIQRERMDLTANAEELRKAFQSLRQRAGKTGVVSVPTELVEQTAKIESVQIAEKRKDAILESVSSRPTGYAIAFDRDAIEQRAMLDVADRIELADLVAQLSIAGMKLEPREGMQRDKGNRVEIDYVIDNASRSIRVVAVRCVGDVSDAAGSGASHA
jgi:hypothetical protein